jgi:hypothetical protein
MTRLYDIPEEWLPALQDPIDSEAIVFRAVFYPHIGRAGDRAFHVRPLNTHRHSGYDPGKFSVRRLLSQALTESRKETEFIVLRILCSFHNFDGQFINLLLYKL